MLQKKDGVELFRGSLQEMCNIIVTLHPYSAQARENVMAKQAASTVPSK